jgi:hypothetical protein
MPAASSVAAVSSVYSRSFRGYRVQVDDAVDRLAAVLALDVLADRPDVVAQVLLTRGLDAGEDAHARSRSLGGARHEAAVGEPVGEG